MEHEASRSDPIVDVSENGDATVVRLVGELDLYNAPAVREALASAAERGTARVVVDLSEVTFVDSTVLGVFVETRAKLGSGAAFVLAAPNLEARRALEVAGLDRHFTIRENPD